MSINTDKCKKYKDTWAAPNSDLYKALEAGDRKKAEAIYQECEAMNRKLLEGKNGTK
jgi:dihydrodipicolinate synthase/N-acetylneuraminate lyase